MGNSVVLGTTVPTVDIQPSSSSGEKKSCSSYLGKISAVVALVLGMLIAAGGAVVLALLCTFSPLPLFCAGVALIALGAVVLGVGLACVCRYCFQSRVARYQDSLISEKDLEIQDLKQLLQKAETDIEGLIEEKSSIQHTCGEIVHSLSRSIEDLTNKCRELELESQAQQRRLQKEIEELRSRCQALEGGDIDDESFPRLAREKLWVQLKILQAKYVASLSVRRALRSEVDELRQYCAKLEESQDSDKKEDLIKELKIMVAHYAKICSERGEWINNLKEANRELLEQSKALIEKFSKHKKLCLGEKSNNEEVDLLGGWYEEEDEEDKYFV